MDINENFCLFEKKINNNDINDFHNFAFANCDLFNNADYNYNNNDFTQPMNADYRQEVSDF